MESMALDSHSDPVLDVDGEDLEKLESDVKQLAQKISKYRQTLPDHLRNTLDSVLSTHRPVLPNVDAGSDLHPFRLTIAGPEQPALSGTEERESREKMTELKERMLRNATTIPRVVKRMRECIERIDKLDSLEGSFHPAFTRQKTNSQVSSSFLV